MSVSKHLDQMLVAFCVDGGVSEDMYFAVVGLVAAVHGHDSAKSIRRYVKHGRRNVAWPHAVVWRPDRYYIHRSEVDEALAAVHAASHLREVFL